MKTESKGISNRFKENKYLILLMILLSIICSVVVTRYFTSPVYQASAQVLIGGGWGEEEALDKYVIQEEIKFLNTYHEIIRSPYILSKVKETSGTSLSMNEIRKNLTMEFEENSQVFSISIKHQNYKTAVLLANTAAEIFVEETGGVMNANTLTLLDLADTDSDAALAGMGGTPKLALAVFAGLCAGLGLAYILPELNTAINGAVETEELLGVPVIGTIPFIKKDKDAEEMQIYLKRKQV